jgi:hypothetical protein
MMYESNIRISQNRGRHYSFGRGPPDGIDCDNREHDSQDTIIHF